MTEPKREPPCATCRFFNLPHAGAHRGECRKGPPVVTTTGGSMWPSVNAADGWCGEHKERAP